MILVAPDKFKGTLSAAEAASAIASGICPLPCSLAPMADGGEGTASILCAGRPGWVKRPIDGSDSFYFFNPDTREAVVDSSAVIGLLSGANLLTRSSAPLGLLVKSLADNGASGITIGVGGTGICDGGAGFLEALGSLSRFRTLLLGLVDVCVPLLPQRPDDAESPSALMFARQKGASDADMPLLFAKLQQARRRYASTDATPFDGAGGGIGFAIANAIGAPCVSGAAYVLDSYDIDWSQITAVITGEGCIDSQTGQGKVVDVLRREAAARSIPCFAIGGCVRTSDPDPFTISAEDFADNRPLDSITAAARLSSAAASLLPRLI